MIKAAELRIGNWLSKGDRVDMRWYAVQVDSRTILDLDCPEPEKKLYSPIELTSEWLEKFGFEKAKDGCFYKRYDEDRYITIRHLGNLFHSYLDDESENGNGLYGLPDNQYVHQLQNLYHSLTGSELTIKNHVEAT